MLLKAIKMNYNMIKNGFQFSMLLLCILAFIYYVGAGSTIFSIILNTILTIIFLWGINKLFGLTIFDREAELIQTLPVDQRTAILAKVITGALWLSVLLSVTVVSVCVHVADTEATGIYSAIGPLHKVALKLMTAGMKESLVGIIMALIPVFLFMISCIFCLGMITIQIVVNGSGTGRLKRAGVAAITIIGSGFLTAVIIGSVVGINTILTNSTQGILVIAGAVLLMLFLIIGLTGFCTRELDTKYNL